MFYVTAPNRLLVTAATVVQAGTVAPKARTVTALVYAHVQANPGITVGQLVAWLAAYPLPRMATGMGTLGATALIASMVKGKAWGKPIPRYLVIA